MKVEYDRGGKNWTKDVQRNDGQLVRPRTQEMVYSGINFKGLPARLTDEDEFLLSMDRALLQKFGAKHIDIRPNGDVEITFNLGVSKDDFEALQVDFTKWMKVEHHAVSLRAIKVKPILQQAKVKKLTEFTTHQLKHAKDQLGRAKHRVSLLEN